MPLALKFIIFQCLIIAPFIAGYRMKPFMADPSAVSKSVIRANLMLLEPPVIFWSIWGLQVRYDMAVLPAAGLCIVIAGFVLGKLSLPFLRLEGAARKTYLISASLANHGFTMGGIICYLFLKETGLALSSIFIIYFMPYTFLVIFSYAQAGSGSSPFARPGTSSSPIETCPCSRPLRRCRSSRPGCRGPGLTCRWTWS